MEYCLYKYEISLPLKISLCNYGQNCATICMLRINFIFILQITVTNVSFTQQQNRKYEIPCGNIPLLFDVEILITSKYV